VPSLALLDPVKGFLSFRRKSFALCWVLLTRIAQSITQKGLVSHLSTPCCASEPYFTNRTISTLRIVTNLVQFLLPEIVFYGAIRFEALTPTPA
jgi:hypothetical protein